MCHRRHSSPSASPVLLILPLLAKSKASSLLKLMVRISGFSCCCSRLWFGEKEGLTPGLWPERLSYTQHSIFPLCSSRRTHFLSSLSWSVFVWVFWYLKRKPMGQSQCRSTKIWEKKMALSFQNIDPHWPWFLICSLSSPLLPSPLV